MTLNYSLRPVSKDVHVHVNFLCPRYLLIEAENLHLLVEKVNRQIIERELTQTQLNDEGILRLHDFLNKSFKPGRRE